MQRKGEERTGVEAHPGAYWAVAALLLLLLLAQAFNEPWTADYWVHLGAVREVAEHPLHPENPFVGGQVSDPSLSPYVLVLGVASRVTGADPIFVLAFAGFLNLALLLYAFRRFVLVVTRIRGAPVWALLFMLLAWGIGPWQWSGYFNLSSIGLGLPYPSMFASGLALLSLSSLVLWLVRGRRRDLLLVGFAVPIILLTHLYTTAWAAIASLAIVVNYASRQRLRRLALVTGVAVVGVGLSLVWPLYSLLDLLRIPGQLDGLSRPLYEGLGLRAFLALPGVVALGLRARRNPRDALFWTFLGSAVVFALGGFSDRWSLGRVFPGMMLAAHVALGALVAQLRLRRPEGARERGWVTAGAAGLLGIGLVGSYLGLIYSVPRALLPESFAQRLEGDRIAEFRPLATLIGPDDLVVASDDLNRPVAGMSGDVLVPLLPTFVTDAAERQRDAIAILSPLTTPQVRRALIERWDVQFVVLNPEEAARWGVTLGDPPAVLLRTKSYLVVDATVL